MSDRLLLDIDLLNGSHRVEWVFSEKEAGKSLIRNRYKHTVKHGKYFIKWYEDVFSNAVFKEVGEK